MFNKKLIVVKAFNVALVFDNGMLVDVLTQGKFWIKRVYSVETVSMQDIIFQHPQINILIQNPKLVELLEIVEVGSTQLALQFQSKLLTQVFSKGLYAFWKGVIPLRFEFIDTNLVEISNSIPTELLEEPMLAPFVRKIELMPNEICLLFINNEFRYEIKTTSYFWKNATPIHVLRADNRLQILEVNGQEFLTKDKVNLRVNYSLSYQIKNVEIALIECKDFEKQLYTIVQFALRELVSANTLDELLNNKHRLGEDLLIEISEDAKKIGIETISGGLKDIILPGDMKDILNQVLIAEKKAQANSIMRREETASTRSLLNTAKLMEENNMLWKLKEMEFMEKIAEKIGEISISGKGNVVNELREIFSKK